MTTTASKLAEALKTVLPSSEDHRNASPEELELMRRQWGICVGATIEALQSEGHASARERLDFYRLCGVVIYD